MKLTEVQNLVMMMNVQQQELIEKKGQHELLNALGMEAGTFYQELEMESRYVDTHRDITYTNYAVNLHSHSFYELLYCVNDCDAEYLVGTDRYRLQKGDLILIPPGISHRPLLPEPMTIPYKRDVLWISSEFMEHVLTSFPDIQAENLTDTSLLRTTGSQQEIIGEMFRSGVTEAERKAPGWELAVIGNTIRLLTQLYRVLLDRTAAPPKAEKPELPDRIMAYVESHLSGKITLADVARHFYISESTVSQTFRKKMGVSFYRHVTQRRLIAAKALIGEGIPLETVGERVGFTDYSAFYRAFKQEYGISPRQYRKLREGSEQSI